MRKDVKQSTTIIRISLKMEKHKESILKWLEQTGIDPKRRGETLSIQDFARLYEEKKFPRIRKLNC